MAIKEDDDDPDYAGRSEEIAGLRTRIMRMRGEDEGRDKEIDDFLVRTKGDKSPAAWRAHARMFKSLMEMPVKKTGNKKGDSGGKEKDGGGFRLSDWI